MDLVLSKADVDGIVKDLYKLSNKYLEGKTTRKIGREAAKPVIKAVQAKIPVSNKTHYRYTASGQRITYTSGNLKRSYKVLFNRATMTLIGHKVGTVIRKGEAVDTMKGRAADGYYYHMVNNGTVKQKGTNHIEKGWEQSRPIAESIMKNRTLEEVDKFKRARGF